MRLKLTLNTVQSNHLSVNYNYALSAAIYKILGFASQEFSEFLHAKGYYLNGKYYKLFSFALRFNSPPKFRGELIRFDENKSCSLYISSPLVDSFIQNFVLGSFQNNTIEIYADNQLTKFEITTVESLPLPQFENYQKLKLLSPLVLSTASIVNGKKRQIFYRYDDDISEISRVFNQNLYNKYELICGEKYKGEPLKFKWDSNYIDKQQSKGKRLTKKVSILKDHKNPVEIIGNMIPFTVEGNTELIQTGYECGFGEKNSMGFGLGEVM